MPQFIKYNACLRGIIESAPEPFKHEFKKLCQGNLYTTTLHCINSAIVKLSKLTPVAKVYRGISGGVLPEEMWRVNKYNVRGGVETAFMSGTLDRRVAASYASNSDNGVGMVYEYHLGMIDRGADLSWLSQYPHEREVSAAHAAHCPPRRQS